MSVVFQSFKVFRTFQHFCSLQKMEICITNDKLLFCNIVKTKFKVFIKIFQQILDCISLKVWATGSLCKYSQIHANSKAICAITKIVSNTNFWVKCLHYRFFSLFNFQVLFLFDGPSLLFNETKSLNCGPKMNFSVGTTSALVVKVSTLY